MHQYLPVAVLDRCWECVLCAAGPTLSRSWTLKAPLLHQKWAELNAEVRASIHQFFAQGLIVLSRSVLACRIPIASTARWAPQSGHDTTLACRDKVGNLSDARAVLPPFTQNGQSLG